MAKNVIFAMLTPPAAAGSLSDLHFYVIQRTGAIEWIFRKNLIPLSGCPQGF
jgi:hypothetical protein